MVQIWNKPIKHLLRLLKFLPAIFKVDFSKPNICTKYAYALSPSFITYFFYYAGQYHKVNLTYDFIRQQQPYLFPGFKHKFNKMKL